MQRIVVEMSVDLSTLSRSTLAVLPIAIGVGGRKMRAAQSFMDRLARGKLPVEFPTKYGMIQIDPAHGAERALYFFFRNLERYYRKSPLGQYIFSRGLDGKVFVDVGANLGMYTLLAREAGATTYMFEPEPSHVQFLTRNSDIFGPVFPVALSDQPGKLPLYYNPGNPGATSLVEAPGFVTSRENVTVSTFSEQHFGCESLVELVKIDVEGNEVGTVHGMEEFLNRGNRPDIWCEVRGEAAGRSPRSYKEVLSFLQSFGYRHYDGSRAPLRTGAPGFEVLDKRGVFDLLFVAQT